MSEADYDVREALALAIRKGSGASKYQSELLASQMLPHLAAFEVRPRGPVPDAEVERVALLLWADYDAEHAGSTVDQFFGQARRLLEAARDA